MADMLGSFNTSGTRTHVGFQFTTHAASGAAVAPSTGFESADIRIYKATDGAAFSATQRSSANGITMTSPFDTVTGLHDVDIDLTDNSDAGFYAVSCRYSVVLSPDTETVDSLAVVRVLAYFEIGPPPVNVTQWLGTAASTPTVAGVPNVNVKTWNDLATVALPLIPTTAGRTLDVSAGGEAGVDWANVGSPTTSLALTGTTIAVTQKVDVDTIKTNPVVNAGTVTFPTSATLASTTNITAGTVTTATNVTTVNGLAANVITATAIAADAIGASELAADAVTEIQTGLSTLTIANIRTAVGLASANLDTQLAAIQADTDDLQTRVPAALVSGRMDSSVGAMAANVVTASAIAADAIGASELAADAVTEIQSGLSTLTQANIRTAVGLGSANLDTQLAALQADTDDLQTRVPAALVSGRMDASVGAMAADVVTASAIATDAIGSNELAGSAVTEIAAAILTSALTESYAADTVAPTLSQAIFMIMQGLLQFAVTSTTVTTKKLDKSTTAMTHTLDSATVPTSRTRAT